MHELDFIAQYIAKQFLTNNAGILCKSGRRAFTIPPRVRCTRCLTHLYIYNLNSEAHSRGFKSHNNDNQGYDGNRERRGRAGKAPQVQGGNRLGSIALSGLRNAIVNRGFAPHVLALQPFHLLLERDHCTS